MRVRTAQKNARTRTIGLNLRSIRPGRSQRRKRAALEVASWCAEDAAGLRRARKLMLREHV